MKSDDAKTFTCPTCHASSGFHCRDPRGNTLEGVYHLRRSRLALPISVWRKHQQRTASPQPQEPDYYGH